MHQSNATAGSADHDHQTSTTEYGRAAATRQGDAAVPASFADVAVTRDRGRSAPTIRPSDPAAWDGGTDPTTSNWAATAAAFDVDAAMTATHHDENAAAVAGLPEPVPSPGPDVPNSRPDIPNNRPDSPNNREATAPADWPRNAKGRGTRQGGRVPPSRPATTRGAAPVPVQPGLMFQPFVRVRNMRASVAFFEFLGAEVVHGELTSDYVLMQVGTVQLGLVTGGPANAGDGPVELNFGSVMPLDELEARLRERRVTITEGVHDTDFGVRLHVRTPDGLLLRIGQLEPIGGRYADRRPSQ
jgi:catechol 2,3-dioxygenase-like lactoylglutathione lyase family enzyme